MRFRLSRSIMALLAPLAFVSCAEHTFFAEESHFGLKAKVNATNTTPVDFDLGFRRGVIATVPMQDHGGEDQIKMIVTSDVEAKTDGNAPTPGTESRPSATINHDPDELMSLFTKFDANIGFNDPIRVRHFLATGLPAIAIVSSERNMQKVQKIFESYGDAPETKPTTGDEK